VVSEAKHGWSIYVPDLPGCSTHAMKLSDVGVQANEVLGIWLDSEKWRTHLIPTPRDATHLFVPSSPAVQMAVATERSLRRIRMYGEFGIPPTRSEW
jgi:predicted RNase H-like HicB family nuclease